MFDPTVWDNLKVVLEGAVYDLDLDGDISVIDRNDIINLAKMSRLFSISFKQAISKLEYPSAMIQLEVDLDNLAQEICQLQNEKPGCKLAISFKTIVHDVKLECSKIEQIARQIWGDERIIEQKLSFVYSNEETAFLNELMIKFDRKIYEENIDDLLEMIPYILETLQLLHNLTK